MSDERRKRKQEREQQAQPGTMSPKILLVVIVLVIVGGLGWFLKRKHEHRLDAFAQCLGTKGAKMYGAYWCPHCTEQKEMFGAAFQYAPYIECGIKGSRGIEQVCTDADIKHFPTWQFASGARVEGEHPLEFLSQETGCPLP